MVCQNIFWGDWCWCDCHCLRIYW